MGDDLPEYREIDSYHLALQRCALRAAQLRLDKARTLATCVAPKRIDLWSLRDPFSTRYAVPWVISVAAHAAADSRTPTLFDCVPTELWMLVKEEPAPASDTYTLGGNDQPPQTWSDGSNAHPLLSAISVFDSECASIHIEGRNEVALRPFGLDVPDELAGVCVAVKDARITEQRKLEKARNPLFEKPTWKPGTVAGKALGALRDDTAIAALEALATLTADETARMERLKEDLSKNPAKAAADYTLKADNIQRVSETLDALKTARSSTGIRPCTM